MKVRVFVFISTIVCVFSCKPSSSNLNIVNGEFVEDKYPTVVQLVEDGNTNYGCSSTVVSNNVILTAAHCIVLAKKKENIGTRIEGKLIKGSSYLYHDGYKAEKEREEKFYKQSDEVTSDYVNGKISRSEYENKMKNMVKGDITPYDLAFIIFDDINGVSPFKNIIDRAKDEDVFFQLSKNTYKDGTVFQNDKHSIFFLGFGLSSNYADIDNIFDNGKIKYEKLEDVFYSTHIKDTNKKQIGYNSFTYEKNINEWHSPKIINKKIDKNIYTGSNILFGDSGGPLIHKNQILGAASYFYPYDCEGNDTVKEAKSDKFLGGKQENGKFVGDNAVCQDDGCCGKTIYASSRYASITLGNPVVETFLKRLKNELSKKGLLESNSIFSELLE